MEIGCLIQDVIEVEVLPHLIGPSYPIYEHFVVKIQFGVQGSLSSDELSLAAADLHKFHMSNTA